MMHLLWLLAAVNIVFGLATGDDTNIIIGNVWAASLVVIGEVRK